MAKKAMAKHRMLDRPARCRIKAGWHEHPRRGVLLGTFRADDHGVGQAWAIVKFDDDEDPDLFKASGIEAMIDGEWRDSTAFAPGA